MKRRSTVRGRIVIGDSRTMPELEDRSVDLVVTSPPYWHIKDYGVPNQTGYGQTLHCYLKDLFMVWADCTRVMKPGARLCVNIGDQFARAVTYGRYRVIPLHAEVITQCERLGLDFMGSIIWQKKTTINTTGGATVMGSFPYPPNGIVEIDYEYIHVFKKPGASRRLAQAVKEASRLTKDEWKTYFSGHWRFAGARKIGHEAMFPRELPHRLIRMFSVVGDVVLDPFAGSGTTVKTALALGRQGIGYEINEAFIDMIKAGLGPVDAEGGPAVDVILRKRAVRPRASGYSPAIPDVRPVGKVARRDRVLHRVRRIVSHQTIETAGGLRVRFLGVKISRRRAALEYLRGLLLGKEVCLQSPCLVKAGGRAAIPVKVVGRKPGKTVGKAPIYTYVYLKNRIFINAYLIRAGLAVPDPHLEHPLRSRFLAIERDREP